MSDVIHLLPDSVANQIAAGEVIQRPASVIKELVENAVDAGATTIHVVVVDAGRTSIQVIDDGKGMSETDARLSFERHATSKIAKADDLFALHTMGFRGEALASIAAVAHVELQTRREADEIGSCIRIAGSKVVSQEPVSCPVGSNFKVENLFFNVPARRKFLKSNATELSNILTAFERIVLVYPDIHFTLHHNGTEMLNLKTGSLLQRISDVFGNGMYTGTVDKKHTEFTVTATGFVLCSKYLIHEPLDWIYLYPTRLTRPTREMERILESASLSEDPWNRALQLCDLVHRSMTHIPAATDSTPNRTAAEALNISQALLSHYENGAREPGLDFVRRACDYYGVSADYLLCRSENPDSTASAAAAARAFLANLRSLTDKAEMALEALEEEKA